MGDITVRSENELVFNGHTYRCAIGRNGFTVSPKEGAKKTPIGSFALRECWYRADRLSAPKTGLPLHIIKKNDGWCDDPTDKHYNTHVTLPFAHSHEEMWREDGIYDIVVTIGFNDSPVVSGIGSAIFLHLAKPDFAPTLGCIAIKKKDMLDILSECSTASVIHIMTKA
jgi:L,D-peptidoglycan transpeptidase YkuD (ErfK/YbiS/YcfS/YnhG family)